METAIKSQIMNNYLTQQMMEATQSHQMQQIELPDANNMEEFKNQVKAWIEIDNQIKKLQSLARERNSAKTQLTAKILNFMGKYNIEDLNTKDGKLRYKVAKVNRQANQSDIKKRVSEHYDKVANAEELLQIVLAPTVAERHSLKRLGAKAKEPTVARQ